MDKRRKSDDSDSESEGVDKFRGPVVPCCKIPKFQKLNKVS